MLLVLHWTNESDRFISNCNSVLLISLLAIHSSVLSRKLMQLEYLHLAGLCGLSL